MGKFQQACNLNHIVTNIFLDEDVFKASQVKNVPALFTRLQDVLRRRVQYAFKMSSRCITQCKLVSLAHLQDLFHLSSRHFQTFIKTSAAHL